MPIALNRIIDWLALLYAALYFPVPFYWLVIHPAVNLWRRIGFRSFWIALPVWILTGFPLALMGNFLFAHRLPRNAFTYVLGAALLMLNFWISH